MCCASDINVYSSAENPFVVFLGDFKEGLNDTMLSPRFGLGLARFF
jgi:hypothetical protein